MPQREKLGGGLLPLANRSRCLILVSILLQFCLQPLGLSISSTRLVSCFKVAPLTFLTLITQDSSSNKVNVIRAISEIALYSHFLRQYRQKSHPTRINQTCRLNWRMIHAPQCGLRCKPNPRLCMRAKCNNELSVDLHLAFARQASSVHDHLIFVKSDSTVQ